MLLNGDLPVKHPVMYQLLCKQHLAFDIALSAIKLSIWINGHRQILYTGMQYPVAKHVLIHDSNDLCACFTTHATWIFLVDTSLSVLL